MVAGLLDLGTLDETCPQAIAATHRPLIADCAAEIDRDHVFVCSHHKSGRTTVRRLSELDDFRTGDRPTLIADLASEGWLQTAVEAADERDERERSTQKGN